jgi:hypothetical protein
MDGPAYYEAAKDIKPTLEHTAISKFRGISVF